MRDVTELSADELRAQLAYHARIVTTTASRDRQLRSRRAIKRIRKALLTARTVARRS